ncbi:hypothetical protein CQZ99_26690 [Pseudomonas poae]|uniref:Uncharacterized protein n=1 Tax=Pseudomonas poae TaxID=200451 RepID=A0A2S9E8I6_9PSED|nr:hypothetical protein CQZ97_06505 [Pseudomonas poae]PRC11140.1 hypothetical protein CQZ99_26690 [Pseudomonas poae]
MDSKANLENLQRSGGLKAEPPDRKELIVPTLRVGMHPVTLRVTLARSGGTRSVPSGIPTQSVGTINRL